MSEQMRLGKNETNKQYHIGVAPGEAGEYALLPGDPGRVEQIARSLDNAEFLAEHREYKSYVGDLSGKRVCVMSTGIGGPSAAICIEELVKCGVHTFIRIGTCGGMQRFVLPGDLIIASAAIRGDGTSAEYLPEGYPACSDFSVTETLRRSAAELDLRHHVGVVQSKDSFYGQTEPGSMPLSEYLDSRWASYIRAGCLASEMETATLFSVGLVRRVRVGAVLTAIWNPELHKAGVEQTHFLDNNRAIACAVKAVRDLIEQNK